MPENTPHSSSLPSPKLIVPVDRQAAEPGPVTFRWEPVDGATGYELEVARDPQFEDILVQEELDAVTSHTVTGVFEDIENIGLYWRVRSMGEDGPGSYGTPGQFIIATPEALEAMAAVASRPDAEEEYGPVAELFKGAALEVRAEIGGSEEAQEEADEQGVEHEGIAASQIFALTMVTIILIAVLVVVLFQVYGTSVANLRSELAATAENPVLIDTRMQAERLLTQMGPTDEEGIYRIPIDRAMDLTVEAYQQAAEDTTLIVPSDDGPLAP